jgi:hypothetical protein
MEPILIHADPESNDEQAANIFKCPGTSRLTIVFVKLLQEGRLGEEELHGLHEDKLKSICSLAKFLAKTDAA